MSNKEHLEHLYQYIMHRLRKLNYKKKRLQFEIDKLSEYREIVDELLKEEK